MRPLGARPPPGKEWVVGRTVEEIRAIEEGSTFIVQAKNTSASLDEAVARVESLGFVVLNRMELIKVLVVGGGTIEALLSGMGKDYIVTPNGRVEAL